MKRSLEEVMEELKVRTEITLPAYIPQAMGTYRARFRPWWYWMFPFTYITTLEKNFINTCCAVHVAAELLRNVPKTPLKPVEETTTHE